MFVPKFFAVIVFMSLLLLTNCKKRPKVMFHKTEFASNFARNHPEFETIVIDKPEEITDDETLLLTEGPKQPENIEYMFKGYNIFTADPFSNIGPDPGHSTENLFIHQFEENNKTSTSGTWLKSETLDVFKIDTCFKRQRAETITGETSYQKDMNTAVSLQAGVDFTKVSASFSASLSFQTVSNETHLKKHIMFSTLIMCFRYHAFTKLQSKLDSSFIEEVANLPKTETDIASKKAYYDLFDNFGTHYFKKASFGSRLWLMSSINNESYTKLSSQGIKLDFAVTAAILKYLSTNNTFGFEQHIKSYAEMATSIVKEDVSTRGSIMLKEEEGTTRWSEGVQLSSPDPLQMELRPITDLFKTRYFKGIPANELEKKKNILIRLMNDYCSVYLKVKDCREAKRDEELPPFTLPPVKKDPVYLVFEGPRGEWNLSDASCGPTSSGDSPIVSFTVYDYTSIGTLNDDLRTMRVKFTCENSQHLDTPPFNFEGNTEAPVVCPTGFTGAQTRIQPWNDANDNVALVCLRMLCGNDLLTSKCHTDTGVESELKKCPEGTKITGMKAQFQDYIASGDIYDDTALNGIQFSCT